MYADFRHGITRPDAKLQAEILSRPLSSHHKMFGLLHSPGFRVWAQAPEARYQAWRNTLVCISQDAAEPKPGRPEIEAWLNRGSLVD